MAGFAVAALEALAAAVRPLAAEAVEAVASRRRARAWLTAAVGVAARALVARSATQGARAALDVVPVAALQLELRAALGRAVPLGARILAASTGVTTAPSSSSSSSSAAAAAATSPSAATAREGQAQEQYRQHALSEIPSLRTSRSLAHLVMPPLAHRRAVVARSGPAADLL